MNFKERRKLYDAHCKGRVGSCDYTAFSAGIDEGLRVRQEELNRANAELMVMRYQMQALKQELANVRAQSGKLSVLNASLIQTVANVNRI